MTWSSTVAMTMSNDEKRDGLVTGEQFAAWVDGLRSREVVSSDIEAKTEYSHAGRVIQLGRRIVPNQLGEGRSVASREVLPSIRFGEDEPTLHMDRVQFDCHGSELTHIDTPSHVEYRPQGAGISIRRSSDVEDLGAIVVRAAVVDVPRLRGVPFIEPGDSVLWSDIERAQLEYGVAVRAGIGVLIRTGRWARLRLMGRSYEGEHRPGVDPRAALRLLSAGIVILGGDGGNDVRPSAVSGISFPVHVLALAGAGIPVLDNVDLEELCDACMSNNRWEVSLCVAPVRLHGATGIPVNPIAVM